MAGRARAGTMEAATQLSRARVRVLMGWRGWDSHYSQGRVWSVECSISVCKSWRHLSAARNSFSRPEFHLISERSSGRGEVTCYNTGPPGCWQSSHSPPRNSSSILWMGSFHNYWLSRSLIVFHYARKIYSIFIKQFILCSWSLLPVVSYQADKWLQQRLQ